MNYRLEVCAYNIQSCLIAEKVGANRVELCANPSEGGTTPSYGTIKYARNKLNIQLYPIIRPRSLDQHYNEDEWEIIKQDIAVCKDLGCDGISIGIQKSDGTIDAGKMRQVVELAYPMKVTCHRAFDTTPDPFEALEVLIEAGCERILTSGLQDTAIEGVQLIAQLVKQANNRIIIMPGSGVRSSNLRELVQACDASEYHTSAKKAVASPMQFTNKALSGFGDLFIADDDELGKIVALLSELNKG